ncbi:Protein OCTOPUS-like [Dillenia turbinata]|uniref:Protein OCTOPUS-like n=1 Tax=Dillenia turbinata TaxID=194707 RepID=A0AAN8VQF8_9MAGN
MCRRHPKHRQAPGVCSRCLSERLSHLSSSSCSISSNTLALSSSSSSLSSYSSSSSGSSCSSPIHHAYRIRSVTTRGSLSIMNALTKSRSMAFVTRMRGREISDGKKKRGFWSKLLLRQVR